jgi:hypothetical protein
MVQFKTLLGSAAALALSATASPLPFEDGAKAVYFQTNKSPNQIAAVAVHSSGKLGDYIFHPTGGKGGAEISATGPNAPDALGSQHSVVVYGDVILFTTPCLLFNTDFK